ncbi:T9SS type A sorting domain-containing protein [Runella salmonicolor]|uniref:T9SS type A sorting domain-containing protein n=1 Tax=Runella salmonicolor TaxID=2950278 RepID=A0ABT1FRH0_9BACT|nr:T9SS type A sorting domain-containing protein [Runella salmonicolor]MCP1384361.1 T9SS type A sorting domain-containing protein [Runella salmonicolor]
MKKPLLVFLGFLCIPAAHAQFFSSTEVYIGSDAVVTLNNEIINQGNLKSDGTLHLRKGISNQGQMTLNGQVVLDGEGTQLIQSANSINVGSLLLSQVGKVNLQAPLIVQNELKFGKGIIENTALFPLEIADNAQITGASNRSHVKGYVQKSGDDAFDFPVGDGLELHTFAISKPATEDKISVGFVTQSPTRLSNKLADAVAEVTGNNYWAVQGIKNQNIQVSVASEQANNQILQLRDNQWNLAAGSVENNVVSAQTVLNGASYFTIGTQIAEASENAEVSVYPNPSNGSFDVRLKGFSANENISLDITDLSGRSLVKQEGKVKDFSTKYSIGDKVSNGSYFLRVLRTEKNQSFVQNLLITK